MSSSPPEPPETPPEESPVLPPKSAKSPAEPSAEGHGGTRAGGGRKSSEPNPLVLVGVGMEFAGVVVVMALGGWWLDEKLGTSPMVTLIGLTIGLVGGVYNLWRVGKTFF